MLFVATACQNRLKSKPYAVAIVHAIGDKADGDALRLRPSALIEIYVLH